MYVFKFFIQNQHVYVVVDDKLPINKGHLLFGQSVLTDQEHWPALIEKAYAKLVGSYQGLISGKVDEALNSMCDGIIETIDLNQKNDTGIFFMSEGLWNQLCDYFKHDTFVACTPK